ncbi:methyltransferase domain-containing protein [Streptomyces sp. cg36]|uniref:methyltransferase domain-containing protein n=1 Tax=Streptomyces sp. cg36 TaxID=3238798 RepID=UPI0034E2C4FD
MRERGLWPDADSPWVRDAMTALARHAFTPDTVWSWNGYVWVPADRSADPERWADLVYPGPDDSTVIQVTDGLPTSSLSCVAVVADMLDSLVPQPGHRVLELGTGAGWNAALLAHRTGPTGQVVSVEADPVLAEAAAQRLKANGCDVEVRCGDGRLGAPDRGPYDRVIATYAVDTVPWAWIQTTRGGGRVVYPWGRMGHFALTVADDGQSATGWLQGLALFMPDRHTTPTTPQPPPPRLGDQAQFTDTELLTDLAAGHLLFALRVSHPHILITVDQQDGRPRVDLRDGTGRTGHAEATTATDVRFAGNAADLWPDLRAGYQLWREHGRPEQWDFGMTVTPLTQTVWVHSPKTGSYTQGPH